MKKILVCLLLMQLLAACNDKYELILDLNSCTEDVSTNLGYSKAAALQQSLDELTKKGIPGATLAVYSAEGWWTAAAGFAKLENSTRMQSCHLQYLQSISKTYMAVAILMLAEEGRLELDTPMTTYLPQRYSRYIKDAEMISVRMLLNHSSGIREYNSEPAYIAYLLQHPNHQFSSEDYLRYIEGKPLDFTPGSLHSYRNTNYLLLALMADAITGDHARYISEKIFARSNLQHTYYHNEPDYLNNPSLVNTYWDRYSDGIVENVSDMQRTNVASLIGDDGIVSTPADAVKFLRGLLEGELLSPASLEEMKEWVMDKDGKPAYGLGLSNTTILEETAWGHTGGGLGAGGQLHYFPKQNIYVFVGINLGTVTESPLHKDAEKVLDQIYEILLK